MCSCVSLLRPLTHAVLYSHFYISFLPVIPCNLITIFSLTAALWLSSGILLCEDGSSSVCVDDVPSEEMGSCVGVHLWHCKAQRDLRDCTLRGCSCGMCPHPSLHGATAKSLGPFHKSVLTLLLQRRWNTN